MQGVPWRVLGTPRLRQAPPDAPGAFPERDIASAEALCRNPLQLPRINYSLIITQTLWIREQGAGLAGGGWKMEQFGLQLVFHFFPCSLFA